MSRLFHKLTAILLASVIAASSAATAAAQTASAGASGYEEKSASVTQSGKTEIIKLSSSVVRDTPDMPKVSGGGVALEGSGEQTDESGTVGGLTWKYDAKTNTLTVSGEGELAADNSLPSSWKSAQLDKVVIEEGVMAIGDSGFKWSGASAVELPSTLTSIGKYAFSGCRQLESIVIPDSVTSIGGYAFANCSALRSVKLPKNLEAVEESTFLYNSQLESITIPDSVTSIGKSAFSGCSLLTEITIPDGVTSVGASAFANCKGLESVTVPESVTELGANAFENCTALKSAVLSSGVTVIPDAAFSGCSALESVDVSDNVTQIGEKAFSGCSSLKAPVIPAKVTVIGKSAFYNCTGYESAVIPEGVVEIGINAFSRNAIKSITLPSTLKTIDRNAFDSCGELTEIVIPDSVTSIGDDAFRSCKALKSAKLPDSITSVERETFVYCEALESVNIPDSVTKIGYMAFSGCAFTKIDIPDGVTELDKQAFESCKNLEEFTLPPKITVVPMSLLNGCKALKKVNIHEGVTEIGEAAFEGCGLSEITLPKSLTTIGNMAFANCNNLKDIVVPESVTKVGTHAFARCSELESAALLGSITEIENYTFYMCHKLKSVDIPDSVTSIGKDVFAECIVLSQFTVPCGVTAIGSGAFSGCKSVTSFEIPPKVTVVDERSFLGCSSLESVTIPEGVTEIKNGAFSGCGALKSIELPGTLVSIGPQAFCGCSKITEIVIPDSVTSVDSFAFESCTSLSSAVISKNLTQIARGMFCNTSFTSFTVPDHITSVGEDAFERCEKLESIVIPDTVTEIGFSAFEGCESLKSIRLPGAFSVICRYTFEGCTSLETLVIPSSVTRIDEYAFQNCTALRNIHIPDSVTQIDDNAFLDCSELLTIHCSPGSYAQEYAIAHGIKYDYTAGNSRGLLTAEVKDIYLGQLLRLTNEVSGKTVFTRLIDRIPLSVYGLDPAVSFKAEIVSSNGSVFGTAENITFTNETAKVSFNETKPVCSITLTVKGSSGDDLTDMCKIQWFTQSGEYIGAGSTLSNVAKGDKFRYSVSFMHRTLREAYVTPEEQTAEAESADTKKVLELEEIPSVRLTGTVLDGDGLPVSGASVSLTQTYPGGFEKAIGTVTNDKGAFSVRARNVPSSLVIRKPGHEYYSESLESLPSDALNVTLNKVEMFGVDLVVKKKELDSSNSNAVTSGYELTVRNKSTGKEVFGFYISGSQLMLPVNEVGKKDTVEVTASCAGFLDGFAEISLADSSAVSLELIPLGELKITQKNKENRESTAMLFSAADGRYVTSLSLKKQSAVSQGLESGEYTVIMMNKNGRYSAPGTLADFEKFGLEENKDYIKSSVKLEQCKTTKLENVVIPELDENKASIFDRSKTSVKVNRSSVSAGQFAVVTVDYSLKDDISTNGLAMEVSVPSANLKAQYNSVTVSGENVYLSDIRDDGIRIPLTDRTGSVIIALRAAETTYSCPVTAAVSYKNGSQELSETIDSVSIEVEEFSFWLPDITSDTTVYSLGTTLPNRKVEYYDNGVLAGTAYSNNAGEYSISFELVDKADHSCHEIYAVVYLGEDTFKSAPKYLEYDAEYNGAIPQRLVIYTSDNIFSRVVLDYTDPEKNNLKYSFVPKKPCFTFELSFSGDVSKVTYAAVLTWSNNGDEIRIPLTLDEDTGSFIGSYKYTVETRPASVSIDYKTEQEEVVNYGEVYKQADELYSHMEEYNAAAQELEKAAQEVQEASSVTKDDMVGYLREYGFTDETIAALDLDELLKTSNSDLKDFITQVGEDGDAACIDELEALDECFGELNKLYDSRSEAEGVYALDDSVTEEQLIKEGYRRITTVGDEGLIFERGSDKNEYDFIDLTRRYALTYPKDTGLDKIPHTSGSPLYLNASGTCSCCDHNIIPLATIADVTLDISKRIKPAVKNMSALLEGIQNFQKSQLGFINSVSDAVKLTVPKELGDPANISNPQLKELAQKVVGNAATVKYLKKAMKFNAALQAVLAPLQAVCEALLALTDLGDLCSMIERLAPQLCTCTQYSNSVVKDSINEMYFQLGAIAIDVTASSIPEFNSLYDLAKSGWKGLFKGLGKLKLLDEKSVKSITDPFAYGRQTTRRRLFLASRFLSDCKCDNDKDKSSKNSIKIKSSVDPSGFVCEAVPSNRIEGVTATLWYSENKDGSDPVVWDAEEWSQENPLKTDAEGHYEWYTPEGWWQVSFEKEGYEKAYSEWVPVLPIQTQVNISMKSLYAPEVKYVAAYSDGVDITFSQYMEIGSVNESTVSVSSGGKAVAGKLEPANAEESFDKEGVMYASKFRFVPEEKLSGSVSVSVDKVKNYNGMYIDTPFKSDVSVVKPVEKISAPERVVIKYNASADIEIQLLPADAAANVEVNVTADRGDMLSFSADKLKTDASGKAAVTVKGRLPAMVVLTFSVPGTDISAATNVVLSEDPDGELQSVGKLGDVDSDGEITANDALTILRQSVGLESFDKLRLLLADVDGDELITANDALSVLRFSIGMVDAGSRIKTEITA